MRKHHDLLIAIAKIAELTTTTLDSSEILKEIVKITSEIMKVDVCSIYLYNETDDMLVLESTIGLNTDAIGRVRIKVGEGITGRVAKQRRLAAVSDVTKDKRNIYIPITKEEDFRSLMSVPLKFSNELIGVINVQTKKPRIFKNHERHLLKAVAHQISGALRNARLYANLLSATRERELTQERLIQSEKMAALGRLSATLSHELRNPLAGLKGASQLLLKKTHKHDERAPYVMLILEEVDRLGRIVDDLIHFAKPQEIHIDAIDANKIIEDILLLTSHELDAKHITVHRRLSKLPPISADSDKFKQVAVNIILNAIEAMPEGGELIVSSGVIKNAIENKDIATFQFRDTGYGIPDGLFDKVFEPFFTTKPTGVGLGLAVCKAIIEQHRGKIILKNSDSGGLIVTIEMNIDSRENH